MVQAVVDMVQADLVLVVMVAVVSRVGVSPEVEAHSVVAVHRGVGRYVIFE